MLCRGFWQPHLQCNYPIVAATRMLGGGRSAPGALSVILGVFGPRGRIDLTSPALPLPQGRSGRRTTAS